MSGKTSVHWLAVWGLAALILASCSFGSISTGVSPGSGAGSEFAAGLKAFNAKDYATAARPISAVATT